MTKERKTLAIAALCLTPIALFGLARLAVEDFAQTVHWELEKSVQASTKAFEVFRAYENGEPQKRAELEALASSDSLALVLLMNTMNKEGKGANANELIRNAMSSFNDMHLRTVLSSDEISFALGIPTALDLSQLDVGFIHQLRDCKQKLDERYARWGDRAVALEVYFNSHSCRS